MKVLPVAMILMVGIIAIAGCVGQQQPSDGQTGGQQNPPPSDNLAAGDFSGALDAASDLENAGDATQDPDMNDLVTE